MNKKENIIIIGIFFVFLASFSLSFFSNSFSVPNKASVMDLIFNRGTVKSQEASVKLIAVGDMMFSRGVDLRMEANGKDYPFLKVKEYLQTGDIVFGNLESPIFPGETMSITGTSFWARPGIEKYLKEAGLDVLTLANNHLGNQDAFGVNYTVYSLNKEGLKTAGAGRNIEKATEPAVVERNGIKISFLAYTDGAIIPSSYEATELNPGVAYMDDADLLGDIKKAKEVSDFVVVSMHAGTEYVNRPTGKQIAFARKAIDSGAELVIGHHPHNIQDVEIYNGKYIFYSLGNFIFDQDWSIGTTQGLMAEIKMTKKGVESYNLIPIKIEDMAQPNIVEGEEAEKILSSIVY